MKLKFLTIIEEGTYLQLVSFNFYRIYPL